MYKSRNINFVITMIIVVSSLFVSAYLLINREQLIIGYQNLFLLPLIFMISYLVFIRVILKQYGMSFFLLVYLLVSFARYVILSFLVFKSGWYTGISELTPNASLFNTAIYLMAYEVIIYNLAIWYFYKLLINKNEIKEIEYSDSNLVYTAFLLFTGLLTAMKPSALQFFSFISVNENFQKLESLDMLTLITIVFLSVARIIVFCMVIRFIIKNIKPKHYYFSFILTTIVVIINSMIFIGTNRADFILNFLTSFIILVYLYKRTAVIFSSLMLLVLPFIVMGLTKYRATTTITKGADGLIDLTDTLQIYLGGIYNVAISLDLQSPNASPVYLLADLLRSAIGFNIFIKDLDFAKSVNLFNERIFQSDLVSQIIPMIGQSELYLGFILAPLLGVIFIFIAVYFTKLVAIKRRFELIYVFTLLAGRLGFVMAQNGNIFVNQLTFFLPLFLIIYYLNNKVVVRK